jgi:hypothetical protein
MRDITVEIDEAVRRTIHTAVERAVQEQVDDETIMLVSESTEILHGSSGPRSVQGVVEPIYDAVMTALETGS